MPGEIIDLGDERRGFAGLVSWRTDVDAAIAAARLHIADHDDPLLGASREATDQPAQGYFRDIGWIWLWIILPFAAMVSAIVWWESRGSFWWDEEGTYEPVARGEPRGLADPAIADAGNAIIDNAMMDNALAAVLSESAPSEDSSDETLPLDARSVQALRHCLEEPTRLGAERGALADLGINDPDLHDSAVPGFNGRVDDFNRRCVGRAHSEREWADAERGLADPATLRLQGQARVF
ncbi:MAG: hypothetical protein ABW182_10045 [Sphingomonas sp.]